MHGFAGKCDASWTYDDWTYDDGWTGDASWTGDGPAC
jgi:hypothetical protein